MPTYDRDYDDPYEDDRPRRPRSRPRKSSGLRWLFVILGGLAVCALLCCGLGYLGIRAFLKPTTFPEQTEDYADARAKFRTKLLLQGPAPDPWQFELPPADAREVQYSSGTLRLKAWINQPGPPGAPKPAVLFLHPAFAFGAEDWQLAQPFRNAGFITMVPILRGENGLPGSFSMFYDEVDDVLAAADALAKTPGVDPNRLYVSGHSAGGTLTMLATMTSTRFKAAASFSGSPDQVAFVRGREAMVPFDQKNQRELQMRSPLAFPRSFKCPIRLYYGTQELPFRYSTEKLADSAKAAGLDVEAVSVRGDHMTSVDPAMRQAITFFQQQK
jgi:dipeptidyl aminopeptidase/acylaminoacyl peptidase